MGNCACGLVKRKSQSDKRHIIEETQENEEISGTLTEKEVKCLELIYRDLASRSQSNSLNLDTFKDFFHLNSVLGLPLYSKFKKSKEQEITEAEFIDNFRTIFNGDQLQLLKLVFEVLDINNSQGLSYYQFINVLLACPSQSIKNILKNDSFLTSLTNKQASHYIIQSKQNNERYQSKYYEMEPKQSKQEQSTVLMDKIFLRLPKSSQQKYLQNKQNVKKILKYNVNNKTCCSSIIPRYVDYLFESLEINKQNGEINFKNFLRIVKQNPNIVQYFFSGFHQYVWRHENNIPLYKSLVPIASDSCVYRNVEIQHQVYISLIKTTILVFECQKMGQPLAIKNIEGLNVAPIQRLSGYGFKIYHQNGIYPQAQFYFQDQVKQREWLRALKPFLIRNIEDKYKLKQKISASKQAEVHLCQQLKTNEKYAMKIKKQIKSISFSNRDVCTEPQIISLCNHKNIPKLVKAFSSKRAMCMILQPGPPTSLKHLLKSLQKSLKQSQIKQITEQLLSAIQSLHSLGIIHRNINTQNILVEKEGDNYMLKLVGFSHAIYKINLGYGSKGRDFFNTGGIVYMAPEILKKDSFDQKIDMYAVGICIWVMVTGELPVAGRSQWEFQGLAWERMGSKSRDFVSKLLNRKDKRMSCEEALKHQWFWQ